MAILPNAKCLGCDVRLPAHAPACWVDRPVTAHHYLDAAGFWMVDDARVYGQGPGPLKARHTESLPCQRCREPVTYSLVLMVRWESALGRLFYWHGSEPGTSVIVKCAACAALEGAQS